ncbi:TIGR01212 family radical SAM protein [Alkaliphilus pronyensis]|uniref:TIGR01212 family radical SAM protein n=1 Tax=Alkaliphilus pronyensis TaxID=1482732 RepID=A0A6I0EZ51_9FIRM|nr:TIGR01212 family radical SAM protein [Alkaliphilus pronyensis]
MPYKTYSEYLKSKYSEKVYKLPVNLPTTCPNRDGQLGISGCSFCPEVGAGFETISNSISVKEQLQNNMSFIKKKYKAKKFIAYFQNFSNTYMDTELFAKYMEQAAIDNIVEVCVSTRPDCITTEHLNILKEIGEKHQLEISIELGLQTVNYHSLHKVDRGHTLAEFIDAVLQIKAFNFQICAHLILNLPWDNMDDVVENAKILSALRVDQVKLHALYIMKDTKLGEIYEKGQVKLISMEEYKERVITFLEYLYPNIIVQRLIGRAPEENGLFVNWNMSWWKIRDLIHEEMISLNRYQGKKATYLGGKALNKFNSRKNSEYIE